MRWPFSTTNTDRELIETRSQNIFLQAKAEAGAIVAAELVGRCMALEEQVHLVTRPQREKRKDSGTFKATKAATTEALRRSVGRGG